jgi:HlyD family secretion protein
MALSRKKKIIIIGAVVLVLALVIIGAVFASRSDTPEVTTVKLETKPELRSTVTASGEVRPIQFMNLTSEVQGRIEEIYVKEGDKVTVGQPLVKLDPTQLETSTDAQLASLQAQQQEVQVSQSQVTAAQNQFSQAQQGLNVSQNAIDTARQNAVAAQTDVDKAQVALTASIRELKRSTELLEAKVVARQEFDKAQDDVDTARVGLKNSQARLESAKLAVKEQTERYKQQQITVADAKRGVDTANLNVKSSQSRADQQAALLRGQKNQRDKTMQVAPINGVIAEIPSKVGTFAVASLSSTALMTIADMSTINIEVKVDETEIDKVAVGQKAKIKVDAFGEKEIEGEVTQKTPLALGKSQTTGGLSTNINVQEAKEFRVVIQLKNLAPEVSDGLRPGMSATATITTDIKNSVIAVPLQAVIDKQPDGGKGGAPTPTPEGATANQKEAVGEKPKSIKGVFILDGNKVKFVEITTGITGESDIEVTSGLEADNEVVTGPTRVLKNLKDGDQVKRQTKKEGQANSAS